MKPFLPRIFSWVLLSGIVLTASSCSFSREDLLELIRDAGFTPVERNTRYDVVRTYDPPQSLAERRAEPQDVWA